MATKEQDKEAKGVDSVTDFYEEKEIDQSKIDLSNFANEFKETDIIQISDQDVNSLVEELEISKEIAVTMLRKNGGSIQKSILSFIHGDTNN